MPPKSDWNVTKTDFENLYTVSRFDYIKHAPEYDVIKGSYAIRLYRSNEAFFRAHELNGMKTEVEY